MQALVIVLLAVALAWGCTSQPAPEPKAETSQPAVSAQPAKIYEERELERWEREMASRAKNLEAAKEALRRFHGHGGEDWTAVVKGGPSGPLAELCSKVEALRDLKSAVFDRMERSDLPVIGWEELGVSRAELWKEFGAASKKAAASLFAVYNRPHVERSNASCGRGEGFWRFDEPSALMEYLLWVMDGAKLKPADIGTTAEAMRAALVADFKAYIAWYRGKIARGEASSSDGGGAIAAAVRDAEQIWSIPARELGLTAQEKELVARR